MGEDGHPALKDVNVRKALAYGFDRFSLNRDLNYDKTVPAITIWDNMGYNDPSLTEPYPYDPEMAKQLLDEAGWIDSNGDGTRDKDGVELVLTYGTTTREVRVDTQAVAQQQLAEIGLKVELQNAESDIFFSGYGEAGQQQQVNMTYSSIQPTRSFPILRPWISLKVRLIPLDFACLASGRF